MGFDISILGFYQLKFIDMRILIFLCLLVVSSVQSQVRLSDVELDIISIPEPYGQFGVAGYYEVTQVNDKHYSIIVYSSGVLEFRRFDLLTGEVIRSEVGQSCGRVSYHFTDRALFACDDLDCYRWDHKQNTVERRLEELPGVVGKLYGQEDLLILYAGDSSAYYYIYNQDDNAWRQSQIPFDPGPTMIPGFSSARPFVAVGANVFNVLTEELVATNWPSEARRIVASPDRDEIIYMTTSREILAYDLSTFDIVKTTDIERLYNIQHHDATSLYLTRRAQPILKVSKETFEISELPYVPNGVAFNTSGQLMMVADDNNDRYYYQLEDQILLNSADLETDVFYYDDHLIEVNADIGRVRVIADDVNVVPSVETLSDMVPPIYGEPEHPLYGLATASTMTPILIGSQGTVQLPEHPKYSDVQQQLISVANRPQYIIGSAYIVLDGEDDYEVVDLHGLSLSSIVAVLDTYIVQGSGGLLRMYDRAGNLINSTPIESGGSPTFFDQDMMVPLGQSSVVYRDGVLSNLLIDGEEVIATSDRVSYNENWYFIVQTADAFKLATYDQGAFTTVYDFPDEVIPSLTDVRSSPCGIAFRAAGLPAGATFLFYDPVQNDLFEATDFSPHWEGACFYYRDDAIASYRLEDPTEVSIHYDRSVIPEEAIIQSVTSERILYTGQVQGLYVYDGDHTLISDEVSGGITYASIGTFRSYTLEDKVVAQLYVPGCNTSTLLVSDGTPEGTGRFDSDFAIGPQAIFLDTIAYFTAYSPGRGVEVWRTDGTVDGTVPLSDITGDALSSLPQLYAYDEVTDRVYFQATTADHRQQVWYLDGDAGVVSSLDYYPIEKSKTIDIVPNPASDVVTISDWPDGAYAMVLDGVGNLVLKTNQSTIDVSTWPHGVYSAVVVANYRTSSARFVVVH